MMAAAAMVGFHLLPEDVVMNILSRLSVKTIKRIMCVCKSWLAVFQNPNFISSHYITSKITGSNRKIMVRVMKPIYHFYLSSKPTMEARERIDFDSSIHNFVDRTFYDLKIVAECEGLICLYSFAQQSVVLFNPAIRQFKMLPQSVATLNGWSVYALSLGFDFQTNDYKVVRFLKHVSFVDGATRVDGETCVELYYLSSNSWKRIHFPFQLDDIVLGEPYPSQIQNLYLNGCCHWLMFGTNDILVFDMSQEVFRTMQLPAHVLFHESNVRETIVASSLRVFDGHLALVLRLHNVRDCFEIHVMKEYDVAESWTEEFVLGPILGLHNVIGWWKSGDHCFFSTYDMDTQSYQVKVYNTSTELVKDFPIHPSCFPPEVVVFTENMCPLLEENKKNGSESPLPPPC